MFLTFLTLTFLNFGHIWPQFSKAFWECKYLGDSSNCEFESCKYCAVQKNYLAPPKSRLYQNIWHNIWSQNDDSMHFDMILLGRAKKCFSTAQYLHDSNSQLLLWAISHILLCGAQLAVSRVIKNNIYLFNK